MIMKRAFIYSLICILSIQLLNAQDVTIWKNTTIPCRWAKIYHYSPDPGKDNHTAVIICPGGSYHHLGMKHEGHDVAKMLSAEGFTAIVLRYRVGFMGHRHPAMIQDIQRTIQLVKERASEYSYSADRVGLIGFSAGGHLVGTAATYFKENYLKPLGIQVKESLKPLFTVMVYPVVTMEGPYVHEKSRKNLIGRKKSEELIQKMSLEKNIHSEMENILIIQAIDDPVVDYHNALLMAEAVKKANISSKLLLYETGGHGFGAHPNPKDQIHTWFNDMIEWLKSEKIIN